MDSKGITSNVLKVIRFLECFICASGAFQLSERKFDFQVFAPIIFLIGSFIFFVMALKEYDNADVYIPVEILQGCLISFWATWDLDKIINQNSDLKIGFLPSLLLAAFFIAVKLFVYFKTYEESGPALFTDSVKGLIITYFAMCALVSLVKFNATVAAILTPIVFYLVKSRDKLGSNGRFSFHKSRRSKRNSHRRRTKDESWADSYREKLGK